MIMISNSCDQTNLNKSDIQELEQLEVIISFAKF